MYACLPPSPYIPHITWLEEFTGYSLTHLLTHIILTFKSLLLINHNCNAVRYWRNAIDLQTTELFFHVWLWTYPSLGTHWTGWRHQCWPGGSYVASPEVCRCHTVQHVPVHHGRSSCNSNHTSSAAFLQCFCSDSSSTSWKTKSSSHECQVVSNEVKVNSIWTGHKTHHQLLPYRRCWMKMQHTHGPVNSKTLLRVCLSSMITAIWMNRSVKQPLGWHYKTHRSCLRISTVEHTCYMID